MPGLFSFSLECSRLGYRGHFPSASARRIADLWQEKLFWGLLFCLAVYGAI